MFESCRLAACSLLFLSLLAGDNVTKNVIIPQTSRARSGPPPIRSQGTTFKNVAMGEMFGENGVEVPFTNYRASDGTGLTAVDPAFESPAKAKEYFMARVAKAQKITRRSKKRNSRGQIIGERAEVVYSSLDGATFPARPWTDGSVFREIDSRSLPLSLKLEIALTP